MTTPSRTALAHADASFCCRCGRPLPPGEQMWKVPCRLIVSHHPNIDIVENTWGPGCRSCGEGRRDGDEEAPTCPAVQHVRQRGKNDCAIACAAMLAGVSYEEALPSPLIDAPMHWRLKMELLRNLGWRPGRNFDGGVVPLDWAVLTVRPEVPCLLTVGTWPTPEDDEPLHAVVLADGLVYDPGRDGPCTTREYAKLDYWVRDILELKRT
jgi:hypothetical protein